MPLQKNGINIPFGQGIDTKTDPKQVQAGKLLALTNSVFQAGGELQKRNGFGNLTTVPFTDATTLTTAEGALIATGVDLYAYSADTNQWLDQGLVQPVNLSVVSSVRNSAAQTSVDSVTVDSGLTFSVFVDQTGNYYQIYGEALITRVKLPGDANQLRAFALGRYFIVTFIQTVAGTPHLRYIAIPQSTPTVPGSPVDISTQIHDIHAAYDGFVANNNLYISWYGSDVGGSVRTTYISSTLVLGPVVVATNQLVQLLSVTADISGSTPIIWVTWWASGTGNAKTHAYDHNLLTVKATTTLFLGIPIAEITTIATNMVMTYYYEIISTYPYAPGTVRSDYIIRNTINQIGSGMGSDTQLLRSVGIASKPFFGPNNFIYILVAYGGVLQPTYFLVRDTGTETDDQGQIIMKLAYSNGNGYVIGQVLPSVSLNNDTFSVSYLIKDLLQAVNKNQGVANIDGVYTQTGINIANFQINMAQQYSSDIATALHLTGGFVWEYDGVKPVEHSFHVWPEDIGATTATTGGSLSAQQYFYAVTYEWTDNAGMLHRSAPSVPSGLVTTGSTSSNTLNIPTLRLTYKTTVRIVIYRWSAAQQIYYQITSIQNPLLSDPTIDNVTYVDTQSDAAILGNNILYTTGGVVEDIAAPASDVSTLFKSRMWVVDSEDKNLLWFSKQVIEQTPVEFSDLFTVYIAPTTGAQGSTGPITALSSMDDKLIIFKKDAIYYLTGIGPDNTGANNDFTDPVFITSTAGCDNQHSIVLMPMGIMFQSDKGIWLLGRDLQTTYIGADVEAFTNISQANSAVSVPATNQVRFVMNSGVQLMYDYYYSQWGTFTGAGAISSTLYKGKHTLLNSVNLVSQETTGEYLDNTTPVLMGFTTAWIKLTGLQGFQRMYYFFILGSFVSAHRLNVGISYDYNPALTQTVTIDPINTRTTWGDDNSWGSGSPWGGGDLLEQWRVFVERQKCQSIQITVNELQGSPEGTGLTLSGLNFVIGAKKGYPKLPARQSVG